MKPYRSHPDREVRMALHAFLASHRNQQIGQLLAAGGRDADAQTAGAHWLDDLAGRVADQHDAALRGILLHGPAQASLGLPGQAVHLSQQHFTDKK